MKQNHYLTNYLKPHIETHKSFVAYKKRSCTKYLVVHCSATQPKSSFDWKTIDQMHRQQGWLGVGYHFIIKTDGTIQEGRPMDTIGSHAKGHNDESIGICLIGGVDTHGKSVDNFTSAQKESLKELLDYLRAYYIEEEPKVIGHRDFEGVRKDCPCFSVDDWYTPRERKFAEWSPELTYKISKADFDRFNSTGLVTSMAVVVG